MKKNVMMRVASIMLVLVLLTSSVISGTFAKYVTADVATDNARVAKFGVSVQADGSLFLQNYAKDDDEFTVDTNTVKSSDTWNVIAPGTKHGLTEVQITGTPEVATRVSHSADVILNGWKLSDGTEYCPVIFTVEDVTYGMYGSAATNTFGSVAVLEQAIEEAIAAHTKDYAANTNLADADALSISWEWPFETGNDAKDTDLGNLAAAGYYAMIQVDMTTTVTQVD